MRRVEYNKSETLIWEWYLSEVCNQIRFNLESASIAQGFCEAAIVHKHGCRMLAVKPEHPRAAACVKNLLVHYSYSSSNGSHIVCVHDMV